MLMDRQNRFEINIKYNIQGNERMVTAGSSLWKVKLIRHYIVLCALSGYFPGEFVLKLNIICVSPLQMSGIIES